jgi:adenylosuccinate synthase
MSVWVVVGGQYGSEGKGKLSAFVTLNEQIDICIRCGGPNSGHSFVGEDGTNVVLRQLPTGFLRPQTRLLVPAGALVNLEVLLSELERFKLNPGRIGIDRNAAIIQQIDLTQEAELKLRERISSTLSGVGAAVARRALRGSDVMLASEAADSCPWLRPLIVDVAAEANRAVDQGKNILIEGTQGFGLSLYHSPHYPHVTSRDTTAAGFLSEVGISPRCVTEIIVVFRTFPIRVAGKQAGCMHDEINWETIQRESGYPEPVTEYTTVTGKLRRVSRFDWDLARSAVTLNRPTSLAVTGLDYLNCANRGVGHWGELDSNARNFIARVESETGTPVKYCGTGPALKEMFLAPGATGAKIIHAFDSALPTL